MLLKRGEKFDYSSNNMKKESCKFLLRVLLYRSYMSIIFRYCEQIVNIFFWTKFHEITGQEIVEYYIIRRITEEKEKKIEECSW